MIIHFASQRIGIVEESQRKVNGVLVIEKNLKIVLLMLQKTF